MIWVTVSSQSCFCCVYRALPSLAATNIISLILVLTIWWCPCVESSLVLLKEGVCYDQWILLAKLCSPLPCFILYSKAKFAYYSRYFSEKAMAPHSSTLAWKIPWKEQPSGLQSMGSLRVRHNWSDLAAAAASDLIPWIYFSLPLFNHKGFDWSHTWMA